MLNGGGGSSPAAGLVQQRNSLLEGLQAVDVDSCGPEQLGAELKFIRASVDLLELQAARRVAAFDRSQAFVELGQTSTIDWLRENTHVSAASADSRLVLARQLEELDQTVEAVEQGGISFESALVIARQVKDLPDAVLNSAQAELVEAATKQDPRQLRQLGTEIRHRDDPEGYSRSEERQQQKRRLRLFDHPDGMLGFEGALPGPEGMKLRLCLESVVGIPPKGDRRSQEQRQADALSKLCGEWIAGGRLPRQAGRRPQLTVIVRTVEDKEVSAELEGVGPISLGTLERLRGEDHVERRQVVDRKGVTLRFGRARRCHSEAQREERSTVYRTCAGGNCDVPIRDCEIHHLVPVAIGGGTDAENGVPLCRRKHHPMVTSGGYRLEADGAGEFRLVAQSERGGP